MGNQAVKPYIIDEVDSDDDICYDTAPESDLHPRDSDLDDDLDLSPGSEEDAASSQVTEAEQDGGKQMAVDAKVVSSLVSNVEELLDHLSNHDYQAAHSAAVLLKSCGMGAGGEGTVVSLCQHFFACSCSFVLWTVCMHEYTCMQTRYSSHTTCHTRHKHAGVDKHTHTSHTHLSHTHTCAYTHTHTHTHTQTYTHAHIYTHKHMHTHTHKHTCTHIHTQTHTHTHKNTHTHTRTHTLCVRDPWMPVLLISNLRQAVQPMYMHTLLLCWDNYHLAR